MLTGRQIREACDLLRWDRHHMQQWTGLPMVIVEQAMASANCVGGTVSEEIIIKDAFFRAGVDFASDGARFRRNQPSMRDYRETLLDASRALGADGDLNLRLTHVACILILLDDNDVPPHALEAFERVRDPLIAKPLFIKGEMVPRDFDERKGRVVARGLNDLVLAELGGL